MTTLEELPEEEREIVALVRRFVDREVKPTVQELEHANTYPEDLIEAMRELGVYGLANMTGTVLDVTGGRFM